MSGTWVGLHPAIANPICVDAHVSFVYASNSSFFAQARLADIRLNVGRFLHKAYTAFGRNTCEIYYV